MKNIAIFLLTLTGISLQYPQTIFLFEYTFTAYMRQFRLKKFFFILFLGVVSLKLQAQVLGTPQFTPEGLAKIKQDSFVKKTSKTITIIVPKDSTHKQAYRKGINIDDIGIALKDIGRIFLGVVHIPLSALRDSYYR